MKRLLPITMICVSAMLLALNACVTHTETAAIATPSPAVAPTATITPALGANSTTPVTLPLIDAFFFSDDRFAADLKSDLHLTDDQIARLRAAAREETARLRENLDQETSNYQGSTTTAATLARQRITEIAGAEKAKQLFDFVLRRWREGNVSIAGATTPSPVSSPAASPTSPAASPTVPPQPIATAPYLAPPDTRIVVNAAAYRMDVFEQGQLIKTYKIGIGYPEFPLPTGLRQAATIIVNPTWTPPDEPWVEASNKVKVGEKVAAGDQLNPLGVIKIPIGQPSLIHGGKAPAKLGGFASHGCVGLTNKQVQDFAQTLANLGGARLRSEEIKQYEKNRTETKSIKLDHPIPVELRYETIVVEDGKLHLYRDVYERGTNTEENLRAALGTYGVTMEQLSEDERRQVKQALAQMSHNATGVPIAGGDAERNSTGNRSDRLKQQRESNIARGKVTRAIKGKKEIVIEIAALASKGYPAPIGTDFNRDRPAVSDDSTTRQKKRGKE